MRSALLFPLALALTIPSPSSADPMTATTTVTPTLIVACTAATPNDSTNLGAKKSASIAPPNMTYAPGATPKPMSYPCGKWVGDIEVSSSATPPAGYKNAFVVDVVLRPLEWASTPALCAAVKGNVEIYKKAGNGAFSLVGGGEVYGNWVTTGTPHCASAESPTFKRVNGAVPASGSETYRFVFPKTPAQLTGTIDRQPK